MSDWGNAERQAATVEASQNREGWAVIGRHATGSIQVFSPVAWAKSKRDFDLFWRFLVRVHADSTIDNIEPSRGDNAMTLREYGYETGRLGRCALSVTYP
jgi:hypothetical protein